MLRCFCGKNEREGSCGEGMSNAAFCADGESEWVGKWGCGEICERKYDCGIHACDKVSYAYQRPGTRFTTLTNSFCRLVILINSSRSSAPSLLPSLPHVHAEPLLSLFERHVPLQFQRALRCAQRSFRDAIISVPTSAIMALVDLVCLQLFYPVAAASLASRGRATSESGRRKAGKAKFFVRGSAERLEVAGSMNAHGFAAH